MIDLLERSGWARRPTDQAGSLDIMGAFEAVTGVRAPSSVPPIDRVGAAFADPSISEALRIVAHLVGPDPEDEPSLGERGEWVSAITRFNDRDGQTWEVIRRTLHEAREIAARKG